MEPNKKTKKHILLNISKSVDYKLAKTENTISLFKNILVYYFLN